MSKQERKGRFLSVGTKLAVATVLVLATLSFLLFKELTQRERRHLIDAKAVAGSMVADLFAASCAAPLVFADNDAIVVELDKLRGNRAIVYAAVYASKEDRIVGESNSQGRTSYDFHHGKVTIRLVEHPEKIEVARDIRDTHGSVVGFAVLDFSLADENAAFQVSRRRMLWFAFIAAGGTAGLLILLARRVIVKPLARVAEAARRLEMGDLHARADVCSSDEVGNLAVVFNSMGDAIVDRELKVVQAQKNVQDLFDNMLQAIFTVGPDGRINNEVSAFAKQIFGDVPIAGELVTDFLRVESVAKKEVVSRMKFWLIHIFGSDDLQWDLSEPERIRQLSYVRTNSDGSRDERALEFDYAPIYKDGAIVKIMFLVKDVTEVHRLQAEIARRNQENAENLARIRQIASIEPDIFNTFISEAHAVLEGCEQSLADLDDPTRRTEAVNFLFRGMHTLKGNARMFKLTAVQDIAHATEDYFQEVRDGQAWVNGDICAAMHERIGEVRKLLCEFEKLGRQVLGGKQKTPGDAALAFLGTQEQPFDEWQTDISALGDESGEEARKRLLGRASKLRTDAQGHGFVNLVTACDSVLRALESQTVAAEQVLPLIQKARGALQITRSLATEIASAVLWPYFLDEAKLLMRTLAARIAETPGWDTLDPTPETAVLLFAAAARSFGLPALANVVNDCHLGMTKESLELRTVLSVIETWLADARNLVEMKSRPETDIDLLGSFENDARDLIDRLEAAKENQVSGLVAETVACARRYRFRIVQETFESLAKTHLKDGPLVAATLRREIEAYENIRCEIRDNETAEHLLLVLPSTAGKSSEEIETWFASANHAGLNHLTAFARSLPATGRIHLLEDIRHFHVLMPAARGAKTGQPVQRVLEDRIAALRDSLRGLRRAVAHVRDDRKAILAPLKELEKAVVHLTTSSLGDVLAPVASTASDLAKERGKPLEEVTLCDLDLFMDAKVMQKIRGAVVHAVRNAVDHGLELSEARISAGKPPRGRISISAEERDGWIDLAIEDDGRGVDTARVKELALARGLVDAQRAAALSNDEIYELLFLPGFSTAASVSTVSGRGVGMDAIRAIARELGGDVKLASTPGRGSRLTLHVPMQFPAPEANASKLAATASSPN